MINRNIFKHFIVIVVVAATFTFMGIFFPAVLNIITTMAGAWCIATRIGKWALEKWPV